MRSPDSAGIKGSSVQTTVDETPGPPAEMCGDREEDAPEQQNRVGLQKSWTKSQDCKELIWTVNSLYFLCKIFNDFLKNNQMLKKKNHKKHDTT